MSKRYFEFTGADSDRGTSASAKFWEVEVDDSTLVVRFGKIGATGQTTQRTSQMLTPPRQRPPSSWVRKSKRATSRHRLHSVRAVVNRRRTGNWRAQ